MNERKDDTEPVWRDAPRVCPDRDLPPYAYRFGVTPHPTQEAGGHAYIRERDVEALPAPLWRLDRSWLYGVDLYHGGFLFEAHVAWEGIWRAAIRGSAQERFLRAVLMLAAAVMQSRAGRGKAEKNLLARCHRELGRVLAGPDLQADGRYMGIRVAELARAVEHFDPARPPRLVLARRSSR